MMNLATEIRKLLVLGVTLVLFSCAGEDDGSEEVPPASVVGTWEATSADIALNDQARDDFAADAAQCYQDQGIDVSDQDVLAAIVEVLVAEADDGNFFAFDPGTSFVFREDNSFDFQSGANSAAGTWQLSGNQLILDDSEATTFIIAISDDQFTITDTYEFSEADLTDSGLSVCIDQLVAGGITQFNRTQ